MRAFDRDPIRGGHYGQRSCEPRYQAEHMAMRRDSAPTLALFGIQPASSDTHDIEHLSKARLMPLDCTFNGGENW
jgi:hypothetical protein